MTLLRPRRWLAYSVSMNDLHSRAAEMLDRFESSEIPLAETFGSSSDVDAPPEQFIVAFGPGVEAGRLLEVLDLLEGIDAPRLLAMSDQRKTIYVGAFNLAGEPTMPLTPAMLQLLRDAPDDAQQLGEFLTRSRLRLAT